MKKARVLRAHIKTTSVDDPTTDRALSEIRDSIADVSVFEGARLVGPVVLVSGTQKRVTHGLGRKYRGFFVVRKSAVADLIDDGSKTDRDTYLYLTANGNTTVSLVVF